MTKACLNTGLAVRVNLEKGTEPSRDHTLASQVLTWKSNWEVLRSSTVGRDHYPIGIETESIRGRNKGGGRWICEGANGYVQNICWGKLRAISVNQTVIELNNEICQIIIEAANATIPRSKVNKRAFKNGFEKKQNP